MAAKNETRYVLTAEDKTNGAFASVQASLSKLGSSYASLMSVVGLGGVGLGAGMVASVKSMIDLGDEMNDLSQKIGINVKDLATWKLASDQSGTSLESVAKGVKGLSGYMTEHADRLKKAGITATDANGALVQLSDIFAALPDGVKKTALAVEIFGKSGIDMIPMLNQGSVGLREAAEKAKVYGERMALLAPMADKFNDQLSELALQSKAAGVNMAIGIVPTLTKFAEQLNEGRKVAGSWSSAMWEFGVLLDPTSGIPNSLSKTRVELEKLHSEMAKGMEQNLADGGQTDLSGLEKNIGILERRKKYLNFLQRQEVMAAAGKLGDYRDARDLRLASAGTMSLAEAMAKAGALGDKSAKAKKSDSVDDYAARINQTVASAIGNSAAVKAAELGDAISRLDSLLFDSGLDMAIYASAMDKLTGATFKAGVESNRLNELLAATPSEQLEKTRGDMLLLAAALENKEISEAQFSEAAQARLGALSEVGKETFSDLTRVVESWGNRASDTFADFVVDGKASFSDLVNSMLKDIVRLQAKSFFDDKTKDASNWLTQTIGSMFRPGGAPITDVALANGGAFDRSGLIPFALGGVVNRPTVFPFAKGVGLMGEAGPEAILPLARGPNGKLGVHGGAGGGITVNLIENGSKAGQVEQRQSGGQSVVDIFVAQIRSAIAGDITRGSGPIPAALAGTYGLNRAAGGF